MVNTKRQQTQAPFYAAKDAIFHVVKLSVLSAARKRYKLNDCSTRKSKHPFLRLAKYYYYFFHNNVKQYKIINTKNYNAIL